MFVDDTYKGPQHLWSSFVIPSQLPSTHAQHIQTPNQACIYHVHIPPAKHVYTMYTHPKPNTHIPCTHTLSQTCIYHVHRPPAKHAYTMYTDPRHTYTHVHIPKTYMDTPYTWTFNQTHIPCAQIPTHTCILNSLMQSELLLVCCLEDPIWERMILAAEFLIIQ